MADPQGVSDTVLFGTIIITGIFTLLGGATGAAVSGYFQSADRKRLEEFETKAILRDKAEELLQEAELADARAHDAYVAAINNLSPQQLIKMETPVRPYEIGRLNSLCAYFPETAEPMQIYEASMKEILNHLSESLKENGIQQNPGQIKVLHLAASVKCMESTNELRGKLVQIISEKIQTLI